MFEVWRESGRRSATSPPHRHRHGRHPPPPRRRPPPPKPPHARHCALLYRQRCLLGPSATRTALRHSARYGSSTRPGAISRTPRLFPNPTLQHRASDRRVTLRPLRHAAPRAMALRSRCGTFGNWHPATDPCPGPTASARLVSFTATPAATSRGRLRCVPNPRTGSAQWDIQRFRCGGPGLTWIEGVHPRAGERPRNARICRGSAQGSASRSPRCGDFPPTTICACSYDGGASTTYSYRLSSATKEKFFVSHYRPRETQPSAEYYGAHFCGSDDVPGVGARNQLAAAAAPPQLASSQRAPPAAVRASGASR